MRPWNTMGFKCPERIECNMIDKKIIEEALSYYNIATSDVTLLRHNENLTFRIGTEYLLQIHNSVEGFHTEYYYEGLDRIAVYESEYEFLENLKEQGMIIREPMKNCSGERITKLSDGTLVTVSKWLEGESLDKLELNDKLCYRIGELTAHLHRNTKGFRPFSSMSYDRHHCNSIKSRLPVLEGMGLDNGFSKLMQSACDAVGNVLYKLQEEFLLLHADLSPSNILSTPNGLVAIDFSFFGMGHPMFDLSVLFGNIGGLTSRQKIAEGYRNAGGIINFEALDACYVLNLLDCLMIHYEMWRKQEWFEPRMQRWCKEIFEPFVRGERLFADDFYLIHVK